MCKHINTTELQNATPIATIDQEALASTINTCVSIVNVAAAALKNPDLDLTNHLQMTLFEVIDRLSDVENTLNAVIKAETLIIYAKHRYQEAKKALENGRNVSLEERQKLLDEYELAKEHVIHCPCATLWAMKEKLNIILENDEILRDISGATNYPFIQHTFRAFAEGIST